jgi:hypothetical protein
MVIHLIIYKKVKRLIEQKQQYNNFINQFDHFTNLATHTNQRFT